MNQLRQLMLEELQRRNFAATTIRTYLHGVAHFSRHFRRPPDQLGPEDIRKYEAMLFAKLSYSPNTVILRLASLRFYIHEVGAIIDGTVIGNDPMSGLARVHVGAGEIRIQPAAVVAPGTRLRVHLLARDIIVSTRMPQYLSVRNSLRGRVIAVDDDGDGSDLISIDIGGASILARVTKAATRELALAPGVDAWALVKAVSLRGHSFRVSSPR